LWNSPERNGRRAGDDDYYDDDYCDDYYYDDYYDHVYDHVHVHVHANGYDNRAGCNDHGGTYDYSSDDNTRGSANVQWIAEFHIDSVDERPSGNFRQKIFGEGIWNR